MRGGFWRIAVAFLALAGCSDDEAAGGGPMPVARELVVTNLTQWSVWDVRLHPGPSYRNAQNRIAPPLVPRASQRVPLSEYEGETYITVVRDKRASGDEKIAFTSAAMVDLRGYSYALEVLENEFRLRQLSQLPPLDGPRRSDAPRLDGGPRDASGDAGDGAGTGDGADAADGGDAGDGAARDAAAGDGGGRDAGTHDGGVTDAPRPVDAGIDRDAPPRSPHEHAR